MLDFADEFAGETGDDRRTTRKPPRPHRRHSAKRCGSSTASSDLDTNVLEPLKDQDADARAKAAELETSGVPLRVPTIVGYELFISVGNTEKRRYGITDQRTYQRLVANKPIVELSEPIAKRAGVLAGAHQRSDGKATLGAGDAIVAATGLQLNEPVVSDDEDFDDAEGLSRVSD